MMNPCAFRESAWIVIFLLLLTTFVSTTFGEGLHETKLDSSVIEPELTTKDAAHRNLRFNRKLRRAHSRGHGPRGSSMHHGSGGRRAPNRHGRRHGNRKPRGVVKQGQRAGGHHGNRGWTDWVDNGLALDDIINVDMEDIWQVGDEFCEWVLDEDLGWVCELLEDAGDTIEDEFGEDWFP